LNKIKNNLLLIACLVQQICTGQAVFDNFYKTGFNNLLSNNVITNPDSSFVFVNFIRDSATWRQDMGLIKLDNNGNELNKISFNMFNKDYAPFYRGKPFISASNSSYLITSGFMVGNKQGFIVNKIAKSNLDTLKTLVYSEVNSLALSNLIKINNNKYYLVGNAFLGNNQWPVIFHLDSNINIIQKFTVATFNNFGPSSVVFNPISKNLFAHGVIAEVGLPNTLCYIDTLGVVTQTALSTAYHTVNIARVSFSQVDSTYLVVGSKKTGSFNSFPLYRMFIGKYDMNLNILWEKTYGDEGSYNSLVDAKLLPDGSIVAAGLYSELSTNPIGNADVNGVILKVSAKGHFRWMREYSHVGAGSIREGFHGIDLTKDGGFILCGNAIAQPKAKAWAVKTDSTGCVLPGCPSSTVQIDSTLSPIITLPPPPPPIDTTSGNTVQIMEYGQLANVLNVFPNPVNEVLRIEFKTAVGTKNKEYTYELINALGQVVLVHKTKEFHFNLQLNDLKNGLYIFQVMDDNGLQLAAKRIVKE